MILEIAGAVLVVGWLLVLAAIGFGGRPGHLWTALIVFAGSVGSFWLRRVRLRASLYWLIGACIAAVACEKWLFPASPAQYYFPVVVVMASLLVSSLGVFAIATAAALACLAVTRLQGVSWLDGSQVATPLLLIYLTAFAAWLSSRQIHMALGCMQSSYTQARQLLEEVRDRRMTLARTNKALEEAYARIERMNYALIEARSAAEEARRIKAEFAANVSHELRTPLNIILGFSETMANAPETYRGAVWPPALRGDVEQIYQSSRHLSSLIDDILDLSALDARRFGLTVEEVDVARVIEEAVGVVASLFRAKDLYLRVDVTPDLPRVRIDAVRIRQVLINLLTNASRFTRTGGVTITARPVAWEIQIAVADTGVGIAPQDVVRVFEDFGQVDGSLARRHEGTGLGVPLSKRLVELHGGRMWLESRPGEGATFYFTLPIHSPVPHPGAPAHAPVPPSYRKAVLVAGPDPLVLRTIRRHMSAYDVIEVPAPEALPGLVERHRPVALIVDQSCYCARTVPSSLQGGTPVRSSHGPAGHVTLAVTRREVLCSHTPDSVEAWLAGLPADLPVIEVAFPGYLRAAQALGIESVLVKPATREQLLTAIRRLERPIRDVLIVDDDPSLVELFARMLRSAPEEYHPVKAFGGAEALSRLRQQPVDLILLDIVMPEVDGLAVLREVKADPALAQIPVIVVSAQYPEPGSASSRLFIQLARPQEAAISETLSLLTALVAALPPRGLPADESGPASPATADGPQAFSDRRVPPGPEPAPAR